MADVEAILEAVVPSLLGRYGEPARHYHNAEHIRECLAHFQQLKTECMEPDLVELAIWFHDAVYDATRVDNERRSAELAAEMLRSVGAAEREIVRVQEHIMATRHQAVPVDPDSKLVVDIDLAILAAPQARFDAYERAIRLEYAHVDEAAFITGRIAVLRGFASRERIYGTDEGQRRWELSARMNIERSIASLMARDGSGG